MHQSKGNMLRSNFYWLNKLLSDVDPDGRPLGDEFGAFNTLKELTKETKKTDLVDGGTMFFKGV
jgi:hypothetical protein